MIPPPPITNAWTRHHPLHAECLLRFDRVIYGLATPKGYFTLAFSAPALHYASRDLPAFEKVVASFRLAAR